jgi:hypothetical protein
MSYYEVMIWYPTLISSFNAKPMMIHAAVLKALQIVKTGLTGCGVILWAAKLVFILSK